MSLLRRATDFILYSRLRAFAVAFVCAYLPLLGSISILITGLVTLRKGALEGGLILIAATAPFLINYYVARPPADQVEMALIAVLMIVVSNIIVWLYAILLRAYGNWSLILELSLLLSVLIIGVVHFCIPDIQAWWGEQLTVYFTKATAGLDELQKTDMAMQLQAVNAIKPVATGLVILSIVLNGLLQLLLARWWEVVLFAPGTLRRALYQIRLGYVVALLFVAALALSFLGDFATVIDMQPVFYGLFFIAGLSLVHCVLSSTKYSWLWLMLVYVALIIFFPKSVMVVALFALLDVLLDLRRRLTRV